ncbi:MAG: hypothetical protein E6R08_11015 [Nevskiaceae bacterium]|nr:MAG: hypothetical protein E6R08_11015 [Nevskiaceae bacterium]
MFGEIKAWLIATWLVLTTEIDWWDVLIHLGVAFAITVSIGWFGNPWYAAAIACTFFYSRELAQQAAKNNPPEGWRLFVPIYWGPHGKAEFLPVIPMSWATAFCIELIR